MILSNMIELIDETRNAREIKSSDSVVVVQTTYRFCAEIRFSSFFWKYKQEKKEQINECEYEVYLKVNIKLSCEQ